MRWREIRAADVDWSLHYTGAHSSPRNAIGRLCGRDGEWAGMTLGDIADLGVVGWRRMPGIADRGVDLLMTTIDAAAEGHDVTVKASTIGYVPRCEREGGA